MSTFVLMGISLLLQVAAAPIQNESLGNLELVMLATSVCITSLGALSNSGDSSDEAITALVVCTLLVAAAASAYILYQTTVNAAESEDEAPVVPAKHMFGGHTTTTTTTTTSTTGGNGSHDHHAMHFNLHVPGTASKRAGNDAIVKVKGNARSVV
jgi:hypothetical protein